MVTKYQLIGSQAPITLPAPSFRAQLNAMVQFRGACDQAANLPVHDAFLNVDFDTSYALHRAEIFDSELANRYTRLESSAGPGLLCYEWSDVKRYVLKPNGIEREINEHPTHHDEISSILRTVMAAGRSVLNPQLKRMLPVTQETIELNDMIDVEAFAHNIAVGVKAGTISKGVGTAAIRSALIFQGKLDKTIFDWVIERTAKSWKRKMGLAVYGSMSLVGAAAALLNNKPFFVTAGILAALGLASAMPLIAGTVLRVRPMIGMAR